MIKARHFSFEDIPTRVNWINNPKINTSMFFDLPATLARTEDWYSHKSVDKRIDFSFEDNGILIGMGGFTAIDIKNSNAEFYVMVSPNHHGLGLGRQISLWMFNYAFQGLKLNKVYLYTNDDNIGAYKIYESAGFILEGVLREQKLKNGCFVNRRVYGLLRSDWINTSWKVDSILYEF